MSGSISDFKSSFRKDLARPNKFDVEITAPLGLVWNAGKFNGRILKYRCEVANMPGRTLATTDRKTYGPIEKVPYLTTYNDMDLTFMLDEDMGIKRYFEAWIESINPRSTNDFGFKDEYSSTITINQYDAQNNKVYSVDLIQAYPISINQLDLDWSSDGFHKLTVTFAYTYWQQSGQVINIF